MGVTIRMNKSKWVKPKLFVISALQKPN